MQEDVEVVTRSRRARINRTHKIPKLKSKEKEVLLSVLQLQFENAVGNAQRQGTIPPPQELGKLPLFKEARREDNKFKEKNRIDAEKRAEREATEKREQERIEAEKKKEQERLKEEEKKKKLEAKELRRQERLAAKKEAKIAELEDRQKRYDEMHQRWCATVKERESSLESLKEKIQQAVERKGVKASELKALNEKKDELLKKLRVLVRKLY